jgi:hypothetical protein
LAIAARPAISEHPRTIARDGTVSTYKLFWATHIFTEGKFMKHPTPSDFIVEAKEAHVSVIFKPSDSHYNFGRLADPEDIARYGPLSRPSNVIHRKTGDTGEYPENEVAQMAHTLAVKAATTV